MIFTVVCLIAEQAIFAPIAIGDGIEHDGMWVGVLIFEAQTIDIEPLERIYALRMDLVSRD